MVVNRKRDGPWILNDKPVAEITIFPFSYAEAVKAKKKQPSCLIFVTVPTVGINSSEKASTKIEKTETGGDLSSPSRKQHKGTNLLKYTYYCNEQKKNRYLLSSPGQNQTDDTSRKNLALEKVDDSIESGANQYRQKEISDMKSEAGSTTNNEANRTSEITFTVDFEASISLAKSAKIVITLVATPATKKALRHIEVSVNTFEEILEEDTLAEDGDEESCQANNEDRDNHRERGIDEADKTRSRFHKIWSQELDSDENS
eukprot:gene5716-10969_t